jgi:methyltransferase (TIGR00027 family)
VSRTALAALQTQALLELDSTAGGGFAVRLYASVAAHGREQLETASDPHAYRAAVRAGALPGPAYVARLATRKRWMSETAAAAIALGICQVAVLGAGFDTLGQTLLDADAELLVVEVDRPEMIAAKQLALAEAKIAQPWPRLVATDLSATRALTDALGFAGWRVSEPALFVAEVVLEYLEPAAAVAVLRELGTLCGLTGQIACTVRLGDVDDDHLAAATAAAGEPMRFRPRRAELPAILSRAGLEVVASRGGVLGPRGASAMLLLAPARMT